MDCGRCGAACPFGITDPRKIGAANQAVCGKCTDKPCAVSCPTKALEVMGYQVTVDELADKLSRDKVFYDYSGGGVTASGGEALLFPDFLSSLFGLCKKLGIHTAVESCLNVPEENIRKVLPSTDLFLCDLKHTDTNVFHRFTGGNLRLITKNLEILADAKKTVVLRVPVIPGFNADHETLTSICQLAAKLGFTQMNMLKYHRLGMAKYEQLGREYPMDMDALLTENHFASLVALPEKYGITATVGG